MEVKIGRIFAQISGTYPAGYQDGHHPAFAVYPVPGTNAQSLTNFIFGSSLLKLSLVRRIFARREKIYFKEG